MIGPPTTMILKSVTETSDSMGGFIETWSDVRNITGVLTRARGKEQLAGEGKIAVYSTHVFFIDVPVGITITEKDKFSLGTRDFGITFIYNPGNMNHHLEIGLEETV